MKLDNNNVSLYKSDEVRMTYELTLSMKSCSDCNVVGRMNDCCGVLGDSKSPEAINEADLFNPRDLSSGSDDGTEPGEEAAE